MKRTSKRKMPSQIMMAEKMEPIPRAGRRGAARQQCCQKEIDRTTGRRILVNYIILVIWLILTNVVTFLTHFV